MNEDSVLQQVRAAREAYAQAHDFDVRAIVADLLVQDARGDWPVVRLTPRRSVVVGTPGAVPTPSPQQIPATSRASSDR